MTLRATSTVVRGAPDGDPSAEESPSERRRLESFIRPDRTPFAEVALRWGTDKVMGVKHLAEGKFQYEAVTERCRVWGHFYDSAYDRWLPRIDAPRYQFLEIGYSRGAGFDAFADFAPNVELHSMELDCEGGKGNLRFQELVDAERLHCGSAADVSFLKRTWTTHMRRPGAPPLMVVVDDGSHQAAHMVASVFFWFPRVAPGGVVIIEDIQPTLAANAFRSKFLPQIMHDLHYCGNTGKGALQEVERAAAASRGAAMRLVRRASHTRATQASRRFVRCSSPFPASSTSVSLSATTSPRSSSRRASPRRRSTHSLRICCRRRERNRETHITPPLSGKRHDGIYSTVQPRSEIITAPRMTWSVFSSAYCELSLGELRT